MCSPQIPKAHPSATNRADAAAMHSHLTVARHSPRGIAVSTRATIYPIKAPLPKREIHDTGYGAMLEKWWKNQYPDVPSSMATSRINGHSALKALNMADDIAFGMDVRRRECCGELWDMLCINDCF